MNAYMDNLMNMRARIDEQLRQAQFQPMMQQPTNLTQNFQLAPTIQNELEGKYAKDIQEVKSTLTIKPTLFIDKEVNNLWLKNSDGSIKTYELKEVIELDDKDKEIIELKKQIEEMKEMINNAKSVNDNVNATIANNKPTRI